MGFVLQFGAGNIGRSLIGGLFSPLGYKIIFVDVDPDVVEELNRRRRYEIVVKEDREQIVVVDPVEAVDFQQFETIVSLVDQADIISLAVGAKNLPHLFPLLAAGLKNRKSTVDIIICENMKNASAICHQGLASNGVTHFDSIGLVTAVIEKMVPSVPAEVRKQDLLATWGERYNKIQLDASAIVAGLPVSPDIELVDSIEARYERKLYLANLMHTATSIIGELSGYWYIAEALEQPSIFAFIRTIAKESGQALSLVYPSLFEHQSLDAYIDQFLHRLGNKHLKDTVYRGARDIARKLKVGERLLGPALLYQDQFNSIPRGLCVLIAAAAYFHGADESGKVSEADIAVERIIAREGVRQFLRAETGLDGHDDLVGFIVREFNRGKVELIERIKAGGA